MSKGMKTIKLTNARFVPEPGQNIHLPLPKKKQSGIEMVGLSYRCSVLVRSGLALNQRARSSIQRSANGFTDFVPSLTKLFVDYVS